MPATRARFDELVTILGQIYPQSASAVQGTAWVDAYLYRRFAAIIHAGVIASTTTVDAKVQQATDSSGTGAKDITGSAAIAQLPDTADNHHYAILFDAEDLDVDAGFHFVKLTITPATSTALISGELYGYDRRYEPVTTSEYSQTIAITPS